MAYLPLSTANLPDPVIDPAQGSSPEDYFGVLTFTGDGTNDRTVATGESGVVGNVNFTPDFVWHKTRSAARVHGLFDVLRGSKVQLQSNSTDAEGTGYGVESFVDGGFTIDTDAVWNFNKSGETAVAWNWKANGSGVSNTDGSITSQVSANTTSGFSIVSYSGVGSSAGATVGHGLNQAPEMILPKVRNRSGDNWHSYHSELGGTKGILLNSTNAASTDAGFWNNTDPTDSVFTVGTYNVFDYDYIAYCFHSVEGFSKFGSYTGNGSTDGVFIYTGFRPSFVMVKRTDAADNWFIIDTARSEFNVMGDLILPNDSSAEFTSDHFDFTSNGFKLRNIGAGINASGGDYIYMAFAENPFKYSNAR